MKNKSIKLMSVFVSALQLAVLFVTGSCGDICPSRYTLELPKAPEIWVSLLGEPCWQIEWFDPGGYKQTAAIPPNGSMEIELPVTLANPVIAWPYWPSRNLIPGQFRPAGALFPFDAGGGRLCLSWEAGVDAVFYRELAFANEDNLSRIPANFDWPRFRELLNGDTLNKAVREDPWLVNWRSVAERTVSGNFDSRRLVPEEIKPMLIPSQLSAQTDNWPDLWYGISPFEKPLLFTDGELPVFNIRSGINIWISEKGILRVSGNSWVFNDM